MSQSPESVIFQSPLNDSVIDEKDFGKSRLLFQNELFLAPSYFEFDEFNGIIITYCSHKE